MKTLPDGLTPYRKTPVFTSETVPPGLLRDHHTKASVWGLIHVITGRLRYTISTTGESIVLSPDQTGVVEPEIPHQVQLLDDATFFVEFWR